MGRVETILRSPHALPPLANPHRESHQDRASFVPRTHEERKAILPSLNKLINVCYQEASLSTP